MLRLTQIFIFLIVGILFHSLQSVIAESHPETVVNTGPTGKNYKQPSDFGYFKDAESQLGIINNQRNGFRTISTRTFRTASSNGAAKWRCCGSFFLKTYNNLLSSKRWKDALRVESAPFHFSCPCDYYVIALRRIIR